MSEYNHRIRVLNELCRFRSDISRSLIQTFPETEFSSEYFTEILLSYICGPSVVKYDILSNNRRRKLHAVIDCLSFQVCRNVWVLARETGRSPYIPKDMCSHEKTDKWSQGRIFKGNVWCCLTWKGRKNRCRAIVPGVKAAKSAKSICFVEMFNNLSRANRPLNMTLETS